MRLLTVLFEGETRFQGSMDLTGLTVLYGRNGVGKTRCLEEVAGLVDPDEQPRRRQRIGDPGFAYGRVYVELDDVVTPGADWSWLRAAVAATAPDEALQPDCPNLRSLLTDEDIDWGDPREDRPSWIAKSIPTRRTRSGPSADRGR